VGRDSAISIVVLPFVNMSSDPEQEYFSDGITEEILNRLAKIKELQVTARTSTFSFKNQPMGALFRQRHTELNCIQLRR
jgi:TolB-like protein